MYIFRKDLLRILDGQGNVSISNTKFAYYCLKKGIYTSFFETKHKFQVRRNYKIYFEKM